MTDEELIRIIFERWMGKSAPADLSAVYQPTIDKCRRIAAAMRDVFTPTAHPAAGVATGDVADTRFDRLAALAYAVADSALDTGRARQAPVSALTREVCRLLDEGVDFDAMCERYGVDVGSARLRDSRGVK